MKCDDCGTPVSGSFDYCPECGEYQNQPRRPSMFSKVPGINTSGEVTSPVSLLISSIPVIVIGLLLLSVVGVMTPAAPEDTGQDNELMDNGQTTEPTDTGQNIEPTDDGQDTEASDIDRDNIGDNDSDGSEEIEDNTSNTDSEGQKRQLDSSDGGSSEPQTVDPLTKISTVFQGDHSRSEVKSLMDSTLRRYGVAQTDENYMRTGDALVAARKNYDVTEMEVLACVYEADLVRSGLYDEGMDTVIESMTLCTIQIDNM